MLNDFKAVLCSFFFILIYFVSAKADEPQWYWDTGPDHPSVKDICVDSPKPTDFISDDSIKAFVEWRDQAVAAAKADEKSVQKNSKLSATSKSSILKKDEAAAAYWTFSKNLEVAKHDAFATICSLKTSRKWSPDLAKKAGALCDQAKFIALKADYAKVTALMPERVSTQQKKRWQTDAKSRSSPGDEGEYYYMSDTDRLDDTVVNKGDKWPRFWTEAQRAAACAPFNSNDPIKITEAVRKLTGDPKAQVLGLPTARPNQSTESENGGSQ